MRYVDPTGLAPIFAEDGTLLGTDADGWKGTSIVMNKDAYKEGMSNKDALKAGTELDKYGKGIKISKESWATVTDNGGTQMKPYVENNSDEVVYYKPEGIKDGVNHNPGYDDKGVYPIDPQTDLYVRVDGVKTSTMEDDKIYKVPDKYRVNIDEKGNANIINLPFESFIRQFYPVGIIKTNESYWLILRDVFKNKQR